MRLASALVLAMLAAAPAAGASPAALEVTRAWSRPAAAGTNGVGYLTLVNHGRKTDALVRVESPLAARADMHAGSMAGGVMSMQTVDRVQVPAGGSAQFAPGGYHIMLMGLKKPLAVGDKVPATLAFASGAHLKVAFTVGLTAPTSD
ncbi:MAG: copper chaperone PCu(A)C [Phenylobacterium sp.]